MTTNAIPRTEAFTAALLMQAHQVALDAISRKITMWASRINDDVKIEFYKTLDMFVTGVARAVTDNRMEMMLLLHEQISSYRPAKTREEFDAFMKEVDAFEKHVTEMIKKEHPYETEKYNEISAPFQRHALIFLMSAAPCRGFRDLRMFEHIKDSWAKLALDWKKELDEKLPLPSHD